MPIDADVTTSENPVPISGAALERLLASLEAEERQISRLRRRLFDRIDLGADEAVKERLRAQEREVSRRRRELHARIDTLRAERDDALSLRRQVSAEARVESDPPEVATTLLESGTV